MRPKLLDLFCGVGGCSMGYHRAGFDVVGVDMVAQPRYPFVFVQAEALQYVAEHGHEYDAIHASPPCQAHTAINHAKKGQLVSLVEPTRRLLQATGKPYVIENVPGAPLIDALLLCGSMFGLGVIRHRLFESNVLLLAPGACRHLGNVADGTYVSVHGGGARTTHTIPYTEQRRRWESAMGVTWAGNRRELVNAIPPAFTEHIGQHLKEGMKA